MKFRPQKLILQKYFRSSKKRILMIPPVKISVKNVIFLDNYERKEEI